MELLVYGNRKSDIMVWDVSTPEKRAASFLDLFKLLDEDWQVYSVGITREHGVLFRKAKKGDAVAAETLLTARKDYEYESWQVVKTRN